MEVTSNLRRLTNLSQGSVVCLPPRRLCIVGVYPEESRQQTVPCRHIPLNESGETLATLYNTGTNEEIQLTLREWLLKRIAELEQAAQAEMPWKAGKAS